MKKKTYGTRQNRWLAGILAIILMLTVIPTQNVLAAPAKMSMKDFNYYSDGYEMSFLDIEDPDGRVSWLGSKYEKTYRGITVGSSLTAVKSKYGKATKKKFDTKDNFNKYIKEYYFRYGFNISNWKSYVEYTYKANTKNDRRLRFYLNKDNKVVTIVYIYKYKNYKLSKKSLRDGGFTFQAPQGKTITTKKINGKQVQVLPAKTKIVYDESKMPEFGVLGDIIMYDTKNRVCGDTSIPLNLKSYGNAKSGTEIETVLQENLIRRNPSNGNYIKTNVKKLGKYNYFEFILYDIDAEGGYDLPVRYYFRLK